MLFDSVHKRGRIQYLPGHSLHPPAPAVGQTGLYLLPFFGPGFDKISNESAALGTPFCLVFAISVFRQSVPENRCRRSCGGVDSATGVEAPDREGLAPGNGALMPKETWCHESARRPDLVVPDTGP